MNMHDQKGRHLFFSKAFKYEKNPLRRKTLGENLG